MYNAVARTNRLAQGANRAKLYTSAFSVFAILCGAGNALNAASDATVSIRIFHEDTPLWLLAISLTILS
jgi:hypothetical protein